MRPTAWSARVRTRFQNTQTLARPGGRAGPAACPTVLLTQLIFRSGPLVATIGRPRPSILSLMLLDSNLPVLFTRRGVNEFQAGSRMPELS
jgi:hypothetical protein